MAIPFAAIATLASVLFPDNTKNNLASSQLTEAQTARLNAEKLAKATRTDANGNVTRYSENKGWTTEAAPLIKALLDAQNREQLKGFTEDAPRAREASLRKDARSKSASAEYDEKFRKRTNRTERDEGDYQAEAILSAARKARKGVPNAMFTNALRSGDPSLVRAAAAAGNGMEEDLTDAINAARKSGTQDFLSERNMRDQVDFGELGQLRGIADNVDGVNLMPSNANSELKGDQNSAIQMLMNAIQQGSSNVGNAYANAASSYQPFDLEKLIKSFEGIIPKKPAK